MARSRAGGAILAGHVHLAGIERHDDVLCRNSGDWVESCTAIVEDLDGQRRLVEWAGLSRNRRRPRRVCPSPAKARPSPAWPPVPEASRADQWN